MYTLLDACVRKGSEYLAANGMKDMIMSCKLKDNGLARDNVMIASFVLYNQNASCAFLHCPQYLLEILQ
jgi:hypothetical protein